MSRLNFIARRKQVELTISQKKEALDEIDKGFPYQTVADNFGVVKNTICMHVPLKSLICVIIRLFIMNLMELIAFLTCLKNF